MAPIGRPALAAVALAALIAGCVSSPAGSPTPQPSVAPSPTLNPNQLARLSPPVSPSRSPSPSPAPSAIALPTTSPATVQPTPRPLTELETLLPPGSRTEPLEPGDLDQSTDLGKLIPVVLDRLGRSASDLEGAGTTCCSSRGSILDLRIRDVSGRDLAAAWLAAIKSAHPGAKSVTHEVEGAAVQRVTWADPGTFAAVEEVLATDDVVFVITAFGDDAAGAEWKAAITSLVGWMIRPRLELQLPETIGGKPVQRFSVPSVNVATGGDTCSFVCPLELPNLAKATHVALARLDLAVAISQDPPGVVVVAFRVPGATDKQLIEARVSGFAKPIDRGTQAIGGKTITWVLHDPFPHSGQNEYLYAKNHILFSLRPYADDGHPNAFVVEAIRQLP